MQLDWQYIVSLSILIMIPIFIATGILQWPEGLRFLPDQAGMSLLRTPVYEVIELQPWITFFSAWVFICIAIYWLTLLRRDS